MDMIINSTKEEEIINITEDIKQIVRGSNIRQGIATIYVPHTTAAITINENTDINVGQDLLESLDKIAPKHISYKHIGGNSYAHIKSSIIGSSVTLIIEDGNIKLGKWQGVYFCEFDGPRKRDLYLSIISKS